MTFLRHFTLIFLLVCSLANSFIVQTEGLIHIPKEKAIYEDLYLVGNAIIINGSIKGDIFAVANEIEVNGDIFGDLNVIAKKVNLNTQHVNTIRMLANDFNNNAIIQKDVILACATADFTKNSKINNNLLLAANLAKLGGFISGNVNIRAGTLEVKEKTVIVGDLEYAAPNTNIAKDLAVYGSTKVLEKELEKKATVKAPNWVRIVTSRLFGNLYSLSILFIFGIIFIKLMPAQTADVIRESMQAPVKSFFSGIWIGICTPLLSLLLAFTVIGTPFALIIFSFFGLGLYVSKIFIMLILGKYVLSLLIKARLVDAEKNQIRELLMGLFTYFIIANIPYLGFFLATISTIVAFGAFMRTRVSMYKRGVENGVF